jgi:hypothetical protein
MLKLKKDKKTKGEVTPLFLLINKKQKTNYGIQNQNAKGKDAKDT